MSTNLDSLAAALDAIEDAGVVSFAGKGLKLNNAGDAAEIVAVISKCPDLRVLNLEGNTLGIDAAKAIADALAKCKQFKRALWKDLFTGRMKDEIPIALKHLGEGLLAANARLTELDLSDNAFGPIGVEGLAALLKSSCCFALQELRLNNNGLGITGGKLLAGALLDCHKSSTKEGKPLALKVFIAGRNRLENAGATALSEVFQTIGTFEEIAMPQNGIYHVGITALAVAFKSNPSLRIINLNDNTVGAKGARSLAKVIPYLKELKIINFGDCLLKTKGTVAIAESLSVCDNIEEIYLDCNEVRLEGATKLLNVVEKKDNLRILSLNGNCFGEEGCNKITKTLMKFGKSEILESLSEDEGEDEDDEDSAEVSSEEHDEEEDEEAEDAAEKKTDEVLEHTPNPYSANPLRGVVSVKDFLSAPSCEKLIALGEQRSDLLLEHAKASSKENYLEEYLQLVMQVASLLNKSKQEPVNQLVIKCCEQLCIELFGSCQRQDTISRMNNTMLVFLNLIKSEDKKFRPSWDIDSCLGMFESIVNKNYFPESTRDALKCFIQRDVTSKRDAFLEAKKSLLQRLDCTPK